MGYINTWLECGIRLLHDTRREVCGITNSSEGVWKFNWVEYSTTRYIRKTARKCSEMTEIDRKNMGSALHQEDLNQFPNALSVDANSARWADTSTYSCTTTTL